MRAIAPARTISDRIHHVVDHAAQRASWKPLLEQWGRGHSRDEITTRIRADVWRTPEGRALRDLERLAGSEPFTPRAISKLRETRGSEFDKALTILEHGITLPS